ncbi:MAG TPA: hypothetical protein VIC57_05585 [Candidatus Dormibacteraeota bacterium]
MAQGSVALSEATRALTVPSPASDWETRWNWSAVPQMSPPPPCTLQTLPARPWLPASSGPPMSAHAHPAGQPPVVACVWDVLRPRAS